MRGCLLVKAPVFATVLASTALWTALLAVATWTTIKTLLYTHEFSCLLHFLIPGIQGVPVPGRGTEALQLA